MDGKQIPIPIFRHCWIYEKFQKSCHEAWAIAEFNLVKSLQIFIEWLPVRVKQMSSVKYI